MRFKAFSLKSTFLILLAVTFFICVYKMFSQIDNLHTHMSEIEENPLSYKSEARSDGITESEQSVNKGFSKDQIHGGSQAELLPVDEDRHSVNLSVDSDHVDSPESPSKPRPAIQTSGNLDKDKMPAELDERSNSFFYSVHFGSFKNLSNAKARVELLAGKGLHTWWEKVNIDGKGELFRVYIGKHKTKDEALRLGKRLKHAGTIGVFYVLKLGPID
jgi:cell division septation protein DedD